MRAWTCQSCDRKARQEPALCPGCGQPTPWATFEQRTEWEIRRWRVAREGKTALAVGSEPAHAPRTTTAIETAPREPESETRTVPAEAASTHRPEPTPARRPSRKLFRRGPEQRVKRPRRVINVAKDDPGHLHGIDYDNITAHTACVRCRRADWVVRGRRNSDRSWDYWCLRCGRSFKSDLRIAYAWRPIAAAATLVGALAAMPNLL